MGREATSTGSLTISAGTLTVTPNTGQDALAVGTVIVGSGGRGYLTMTGGSLVARGLTVGGENLSTGSGLSSVSLSNNAAVTVSGGGGNVTFNRNLTITGPNVNFSDTGNVRLNSTNVYNAVITSATAHSPIKATGNVILGGNLNISFSGLATNPAVGQTWNLFDYGAGLGGSFANAAFGADVNVTGLPQAVPLGAAFRLHQATGGTNGKLIQLVQDRILVLQVNRDTGELRVTNPQGGAINMDSYLITSYTGGSLKSTYKGISGAPAGDTGWAKSLSNATMQLSENKQTGSFNVSGIGASGITLGNGFDKLAVDTTLGGALGTNGEDLSFYYGDPASSSQIKGQVQYIGTPFENNLVLTVNSTTGAATLKNDSLHNLLFDGYSILSSTGKLSAGGYTGIGGMWEKTTVQAPNSLSETNPHGPMTLAAGASVSLGTIGVIGTGAADQAGVSLQFLRQGGSGDYNNDGTVNAADYTVWRDHLGQSFALPNEDSTATPGTVTVEDYNIWKTNFGHTGGGLVGEASFRTGVVHFVTSGPGAGAAVPEPSSYALLLFGLSALAFYKRNVRSFASARICQIGGKNMARQLGLCMAAVAAFLSGRAHCPTGRRRYGGYYAHQWRLRAPRAGQHQDRRL